MSGWQGVILLVLAIPLMCLVGALAGPRDDEY
jgi:hypothetical protein